MSLPPALGDPGRKVKHDPRSKGYPAPQAPQARTVEHVFTGDVLDQGGVRCCTATALTHLLGCGPFRPRRSYVMADALSVYARGTLRDDTSGWWPRNDNGLASLDAAEAAQDLGMLIRYEWAFGLDHLLKSLVYRPFLIGVPLYEGMRTPDVQGWIRPSGERQGGHALVAVGADVDEGYVTLLNSWGEQWGAGGYARIAFEYLDALLTERGDCMTVSVLAAQRAPAGRGSIPDET